jgi:hypothetical protein
MYWDFECNRTPPDAPLLCALEQPHMKFARCGRAHSNVKQRDTTSVNTFAICAQQVPLWTRHSYIHACIPKETPMHPPILARI